MALRAAAAERGGRAGDPAMVPESGPSRTIVAMDLLPINTIDLVVLLLVDRARPSIGFRSGAIPQVLGLGGRRRRRRPHRGVRAADHRAPWPGWSSRRGPSWRSAGAFLVVAMAQAIGSGLGAMLRDRLVRRRRRAGSTAPSGPCSGRPRWSSSPGSSAASSPPARLPVVAGVAGRVGRGPLAPRGAPAARRRRSARSARSSTRAACRRSSAAWSRCRPRPSTSPPPPRPAVIAARAVASTVRVEAPGLRRHLHRGRLLRRRGLLRHERPRRGGRRADHPPRRGRARDAGRSSSSTRTSTSPSSAPPTLRLPVARPGPGGTRAGRRRGGPRLPERGGPHDAAGRGDGPGPGPRPRPLRRGPGRPRRPGAAGGDRARARAAARSSCPTGPWAASSSPSPGRDETVGYALDPADVAVAIMPGIGETDAVDTGPCIR